MLLVLFFLNFLPLGGDRVHAEVLFSSQEVRDEASYSYVPGDRRDPFQPIVESVQPIPSNTSKPNELRMPSASWKVLGIMSGLNGTQAVLQNKRGDRYIVSPGDVIGTQHLRVVQLTQSSVTLESISPGAKNDARAVSQQTLELRFGQ